MQAVANIRQLIVRHGQLAESRAVVQGFAEVSESIVLQHQGVKASDLLYACGHHAAHESCHSSLQRTQQIQMG